MQRTSLWRIGLSTMRRQISFSYVIRRIDGALETYSSSPATFSPPRSSNGAEPWVRRPVEQVGWDATFSFLVFRWMQGSRLFVVRFLFRRTPFEHPGRDLHSWGPRIVNRGDGQPMS